VRGGKGEGEEERRRDNCLRAQFLFDYLWSRLCAFGLPPSMAILHSACKSTL
jgi:hypothetical protein